MHFTHDRPPDTIWGMDEYPCNRAEFERWFASERSCLDYLCRVRWPGGFQCPKCRSIRAGVMQRGLFRCQACDYQISLTAGTILQGTRKPIRAWFEAIWLLADTVHGVSADGLQQVLGLGSYHTAWVWMRKLRWAMVDQERLEGVVQAGRIAIEVGKSQSSLLLAVQLLSSAAHRVRMTRLPDGSCDVDVIGRLVKAGAVLRVWCGQEPELCRPDCRCEMFHADDGSQRQQLPLAVHEMAEEFTTWQLNAYRGT